MQFSPLVSAHCTAVDGDVTDSMVAWIGAQAATGVGLVTIGSTPVDFGQGRDFYGCLSATRDTDVAGLERLSIEAHRYGAKISCELIHAGCVANQARVNEGPKALVPSLTEYLNPNWRFQEITEEEILQVVDEFAAAARRLRQANFDCVMIHMAHGNLLSAFLTPLANRRTDQYGGSRENRMRFPLMVLKAVREAIGAEMAMELRISSWEYLEGSPSIDDVVAFLQQAQRYVNLVNLSGGLIWDPKIVPYMMPGYNVERCINVERTAYVRERLDIPVSAVGNIPDIATAEQILVEGKADVIAMARNLVADMEFVKKAYRNAPEEIRPCLHCNVCCTTPGRAVQMRCSVNPRVGRETIYGSIYKVDKPKKVMVIGGGPAGMQAAQTACLRGHNVTLYEKTGKLGGRLAEASSLWCKDYFRRYTAWDIRETEKCSAEIILNTEVTPELIAAKKPDVVIVAVGAEHVKPKSIPGLDSEHVIDVTMADLHQGLEGSNIVYCGGGTSAVESAIDLAHEGYRCTVINNLSLENSLSELSHEIRSPLLALMEKYGVNYITEACVTAIEDGTVLYTKDGQQCALPFDTAVTSFGLRPNEDVVDGLQFVVPESYVVGDAQSARNIYWANMSAFDCAVEIQGK